MANNGYRHAFADWFEMTGTQCPICNHVGGCMINFEEGKVSCIRVESDVLFATSPMQWLHIIDEEKAKAKKPDFLYQAKRVEYERRSDDYLNMIWSKVIMVLGLDENHLEHLRNARGLSDAAISRNGYASFTEQNQWTDWNQYFAKDFGEDWWQGVFGMRFSDKTGKVFLSTMPGIIIPFFNSKHQIVGAQNMVDRNEKSIKAKFTDANGVPVEQPDNWKINIYYNEHDSVYKDANNNPIPFVAQIVEDGTKGIFQTFEFGKKEAINQNLYVKFAMGAKYIWISNSNGFSMVTNNVVRNTQARSVLVTEGGLKVSIIADRWSKFADAYIGIAGVNNVSNAFDEIQKFGTVDHVYIAFDADWHSNNNVQASICDLIELCKQDKKIKVDILNWDESLGKGLDDVILAGNLRNVRLLETTAKGMTS
jgi:hypothetical protein